MGNLIAKTSGEIASFMSPSVTNIKSLKVHFSPKQLGTGDPSPTNNRPITGWTGVDIRKSNENLWDDEWYSYGNVMQPVTDQSDDFFGYWSGAVKRWDNALRPITFNLFPRGVDKLTVTADYGAKGGAFTFRVYFRYIDGAEGYHGGNISIGADAKATVTRTSNSNYNKCTGFVISTSASVTNFRGRVKNVRVTVNDSTEYVIPVTTLIPISWADSVGTVYGGYVDLISGELVQDMAYGQVTSEWLSSRESGYIGYTSSITALDGASGIWVRNAFNSTARERKSGGIKANCNAFKVLMNSTGVSSSQNRTAFAVDGESITSVADFISTVETLEQNDNGLYLAYELAEPITHQLTPIQLQSFVGQNNFWSNADYVEIEYDLIETIDIQKAKQKIILNQPHIESVTGNITSFTTNMKAPLKECKVYFNPIQEGSGDPSPDNVRNIVGWDGVNVGLPNEYQEVEYIESTGTQYIITDIPIQQPVTIYIDVMPLSGSNDQAFFVASYEASPHNVRLGTGYYASRIQNYYQRYYTLGDSNSMRINTRHHAEVYLSQGLQTAVLDGTRLQNTSHALDSTLLPIDGNKINFFMFAEGRLRTNDNVDALFKSYARIYALKIDNADSTIGDFIPCYRKSDGEIGMYDIVSKTFYTNSGTGTFLKGDDVNTIIGNISWSDDVGTVYGGYVDLVKGELVSNWIKRDLSEMSTINAPNTSLDEPWNHRFLIENWDYNNSGWEKANGRKNFIIDNITNDENGRTNFTAVGIDNSPIIYIYDNTISTVEEFKTKYSEHYVCYETKFPIHYQLTPQQLLTFKGTNNIWSDTNGQTEVKFWTH